MHLKNIDYTHKKVQSSFEQLPPFSATFQEFLQFSWPRFLKIQGCTLLEDVNYEQLFQLTTLTPNSLTAIETELNKRRLVNMLPENSANSHAALKRIGQQIQQIWQAKLKLEFPQKRYAVIFTEREMHDDIDQFELTFFQIRDQM